MSGEHKQKVTPPELAREWGIHVRRVRDWISGGVLRAINISPPGNRPKWLIDRADIAAFERSLANRVYQPDPLNKYAVPRISRLSTSRP
jgi:hypothetical protein